MNRMDKKAVEQKSVEKWQLIIQWICAALWLTAVVCDLIGGQNLFLTITQSVAAVCFTAAAIVLTWRYRKVPHDAGKN